MCAFCHGGSIAPKTPSFSYLPGETLADYFFIPSANQGITSGAVVTAGIDVHGNQVGLMEMSRCFRSSTTMTCSTCHDVHVPQRNLAAFSERCLTCHQIDRCLVYPKAGRQIAGKCVDCHMPNQESSKIVVNASDGKNVRPRVRNHRIKVYPEESQAVLKQLQVP